MVGEQMKALLIFVLAINLFLIIAWKKSKVIIKEVEVIREIPIDGERPKERDFELEREIQRAKAYQRDFNELMAYDVHIAYAKKEVD